MSLDKVLKFNGLIIWPYNNLKNQYIKDEVLKSHIDKIVKSYTTLKGWPERNPAIISTPDAGFNNPNIRTANKIEVLKNILLFSSILNMRMFPVTSENFEVYYHRFKVGEHNISTDAGMLFPIRSGGYELGKVRFMKPDYIHTPLGDRVDINIFNALEKCFSGSNENREMNSIIQSLNPFFNAFVNIHSLSWYSRILLLLIAFEILFTETKRENFRKNIEKYSIDNNNLQREIYQYEIRKIDGKKIDSKMLSINQIWAEEFYRLRDKIIHGNPILQTDYYFKDQLGLAKKHQHHFVIATNFFVVCLINKLREINYSEIPEMIISENPRIPISIFGNDNEQFKIGKPNWDRLLTR